MIPPAQIITGSPSSIHARCLDYLTSVLCTSISQPAHDRTTCHTCASLSQRQHHDTTWITPSKQYYVLADLEVIFHTSALKLEEGEHHFFILERAETLSSTCGNKLLKILEEPPRNYHFILLSNNINLMLPTITSRAHIVYTSDTDHEELPPLLSYFTSHIKLHNPFGFTQELKKVSPNEYESLTLVDLLLSHFQKRYTDALKTSEPSQRDLRYLSDVIAHLTHALKTSPQPGSASLFWKHIFLTFPRRSHV